MHFILLKSYRIFVTQCTVMRFIKVLTSRFCGGTTAEDNLASIFPSPDDAWFWKASRLTHQFSGSSLGNHEVSRGFFVNNIWRYHHF